MGDKSKVLVKCIKCGIVLANQAAHVKLHEYLERTASIKDKEYTSQREHMAHLINDVIRLEK